MQQQITRPERKQIKNIDFNCDLAQSFGVYKNSSEFELLDYFMSNQGIALTRERILDSVWSYDYFGDARTIDTHVKKLRSKMGAKGDYIKTVWGVGYKFEIQ